MQPFSCPDPRRLAASFALASLVLAPILVLAQNAPSTASETRIVLEDARGVPATKPLAGFETTDPRTLGAHIVRFESSKPSSVAAVSSETAEILLGGGDQLRGAVRRAEAESIEVEIAGGVRVRASLDDLTSLVFSARVPSSWHGAIERAKEGDRLYRLQGSGVERLEGAVEEFSADALSFHDARVGNLKVAWKDVVALFVESTARAEKHAQKSGVPIVVDLVDRSRLSGALVKIDAAGVALEARGGQKLLIPIAALVLLLVDDGTLVLLSDLAPAEAKDSTPFGDDLGMRWPPRIDASVTGAPLNAGGRAFARGIGVHAPSRMTWKIPSGVAALRGLAAIDDQVLRMGARGSVVFRVLVDGAKRWQSPIVRGGDAPVAIVLDPPDLGGATTLTLEVDPSEDSFVCDRADWLQMLLVRAPGAK